MGFLAVLNFTLKCFHLFAWPSFALGYPLCASIRAIETNSNYHMRKLTMYWILFSLISLFELAFIKLIEWVPLWPYLKLGTICWLVLPRFRGAQYCYRSFLHPCLSVNLEEVQRMLNKREVASLEKNIFLSVAERYVTENGTEALEKLIASKGSSTRFGVDEIKEVAEAEKKDVRPAVKEVAEAEKKDVRPAVKSNFNEFNISWKETSRAEPPKNNASAAANSVMSTDANLVKPEKRNIAAEEVKELSEPMKEVQKEWACPVCQVTTSCEANLNSHFRGRKHKAKCEELKLKVMVTKQTARGKAASSSAASKAAQANQASKEPVSGKGINEDKVRKQQRKFKLVSKVSQASKT